MRKKRSLTVLTVKTRDPYHYIKNTTNRKITKANSKQIKLQRIELGKKLIT